MRRTILLLGVVGLLFAPAVPAFGVWGGVPDGTLHPMVGALYRDFNADGQITGDEWFCSGSYAGWAKDRKSQVFLTAGHCVAIPASQGVTTFYVSFDEDPLEGDRIPEGLIQASSFAVHPLFGSAGIWGNPYDSAILLLPARSVKGIAPVMLPPVGYLDELNRSGALQHTQIELVGYGIAPEWHQPGGTQFVDDGIRETAMAEITGLMQPWLRFQQNVQATGLGGICGGDSGSPNLIPGTLLVVSTTTGTGGMGCNAFGLGYRLDTPEARGFLGLYLTLP